MGINEYNYGDMGNIWGTYGNNWEYVERSWEYIGIHQCEYNGIYLVVQWDIMRSNMRFHGISWGYSGKFMNRWGYAMDIC
jgi:hypothetical protein